MPSKPKRPCNHPMCPALTTETYCENHKRKKQQRQDQRRGTAAQRGYNYKWQKAREVYLKQNPLCVTCDKDGEVTAATVVDHIIPHKGDQGLFWDVKNWQPLCKQCHDRKTVLEDGGFGNEQRK